MTTAVEIVLFDGWDELDALAPYEVLRQAARRGAPLTCRLVTLGEAREVEGANGLRILSTGPLGQPDWLVIPGGGWGDRAERGASVCTGALLVAAAGLLEGRPAVTHRSALGDLARAGAEVVEARVVDDGDLVTAGGVTSGLDLGLQLLGRIAGSPAAEKVAVEMEIVRGRVYLGPRAPLRTDHPPIG